MKRTHVQMEFAIDDYTDTRAEVRTFNGRWTAEAAIRPQSIGTDFGSSDDARRALAKKLREMADAVERDA